MFKTLSIAATAIAISASAVIPAAPAAAQGYGRYYGDGRYDGYRGGYQGYDNRSYDDRSYDRGYYNHQGYRGYRDRCRTGATGTIIGAIAGGLFGSAIAGRGDHTLGAVLGAGAGALAGNAVEKGNRPDYCRR